MLMSDPQPTDAFTWTQEPWGRALRCTRLAAPHLFTSRDLVAARRRRREWAAVAGVAGRPDAIGCCWSSRCTASTSPSPRAARPARGRVRRPTSSSPTIRRSRSACASRTARRCCCYDPVTQRRRRGARGLARHGAGAAAAAVRAMQEEFGTRPADLVAAIGPCLGACCGEVGPEVVEAFRAGGAEHAAIDAWFTPGTRRSIVPRSRAREPRSARARRASNPDAIFASGLCTKTHHDRLHSYRGDRDRRAAAPC